MVHIMDHIMDHRSSKKKDKSDMNFRIGSYQTKRVLTSDNGCSQDSHFLSPNEFKQLYYRLMHRYPNLLPRHVPSLRCFSDGRLQLNRTPALRVTVYSAKNLPPADVNGKADPYCTMQLVGASEFMSFRVFHVFVWFMKI